MHPLWHLIPAAVCAIAFAFVAESWLGDIKARHSDFWSRQTAYFCSTTAITLAATIISLIPPALWTLGALS
jgi:hypothetical protein